MTKGFLFHGTLGLVVLLFMLPMAKADGAPGTSSADPFDSSRGTVILADDVIIDAINVFRTSGGFEEGHALMRNGGLDSVSFIEFQTATAVSIRGVRLFAKNDGAANGFRRALSRFRLLADLDNGGSFETPVLDSGSVNPDYGMQAGNASIDPEYLDLSLTNLGGGVVTAQHWRLEVTQGSDLQPFEGARIIEVDAIPAGLIVTNASDTGPGTLREAIETVNAVEGTNLNYIHFAITGVIELINALPVVQSPVIISGPGSASLSLQRSAVPGTPEFRILAFNAPSATLSGVTLRNGVALEGAGVRNGGHLILSHCVITANHGLLDGSGAGIFNDGTLTMADCAVVANSGLGRSFAGAGLRHTHPPGADGGRAEIDRCTFSGNVSEGRGGGIYVDEGLASSLAVRYSTLSSNYAAVAGGAIASGIVMPLPNPTLEQLGRASTYTAVNLNQTAYNWAIVSPGDSVTFTANYTGVYTDGAGCPGCITQHHLGINGVHLECHEVPGNGSLSLNFNAPSSNGVYYLTQAPSWWFFCGQFAPPTVESGPGNAVAVLFVGPPTNLSALVNLTNCTISGNTAGQRAGALAHGLGAVVTLSHSTMAGNAAADAGGVDATAPDSQFFAHNSIMAGNSGAAGPDVLGVVVSLGHNLLGLDSGNTGMTNGVQGDLAGTGGSPLDPRLAELQNNGGQTLTRSLLGGSPAFNAGDNVDAPPLDQRGLPRIWDGVMDIGALELQPSAPTIICPTNLLTCGESGAGSPPLSFAPQVTGVPEPMVLCAPPSGSGFPIGTTQVHCLATNVIGTNSCTFEVVVYSLTNVVNSLADAGPGSLREAIAIANHCPGTNFIVFDITGTIVLTAPLPELVDAVILRGPGSTQLVLQRSTAPGTPEFGILIFYAPYAELSGMTISNGAANVGAGLFNGGVLVVSNCVIAGNTGTGGGCGAGVFNQGNLTIVDSAITGNNGQQSSFWGGGIDNRYSEGGAGILRLVRTVISGNHSDGLGGGIRVSSGEATFIECSVSGNTAGFSGGGLYLASGRVELSATTVAQNSCPEGGGGLFIAGGSLVATNSTVSGNASDSDGGGIFLAGLNGGGGGEGEGNPPEDGDLLLAHCTVAGNTATSVGGGVYIEFITAPFQLRNTIIASNFSLTSPEERDLGVIDSVFTSLGHNLVGVQPAGFGLTNGVNGDQIGAAGAPIDPRLGPLADHGGLTLTHALLADSPALNAGSNPGAPALDQRGALRVAGGVIDIGAFEFPALAPSILCPTDLTTCPTPGLTTAVVTFAPSGGGAPMPAFQCSPPSGSTFPGGVTTVTCLASNIVGVEQCTFSVTVFTPPVATPLVPQVIAEGLNAQFCTLASGTGPFNYQWFREGVLLADETNTCFTRATVALLDGGNYCVRVAGLCGTATQCVSLVVTTAQAAPQVVSATILPLATGGLGRILVIFSEDMDPTTLTNAANYQLSGASILGIVYPVTSPRRVILRTSPLQCDNVYPFAVSGVRDMASRLLNPHPTLLSLSAIDLDYCNQTYILDLPAGSSLIANQLNRGGNKLSDVLPIVPVGASVALLNSNQVLQTYTFAPGGWDGDPVLTPGSGFFIQLEAPTNLTFRGSVPVQVLPVGLPADGGLTLVSAQTPTRATYTNVIGLPPAEGTLLYRHRPGAPPLPVGPANYVMHLFRDGEWNMGEPVAELGEAFFVAAFESIRILTQPANQPAVAPGATVSLGVVATGTGPLRYQWRRNGVLIPDATNAVLTIPNVQPADAGSYSVVVANEFDARSSETAVLRLVLPLLPLTNNFAEAVLIEDRNGLGANSNVDATAEPLELRHAGKAGGKSMWMRWRSTVAGIVTFRTTGSSFDTLLAAYTGNVLGNLVAVVSDEDSGGFLTSAIQFNAEAGTIYHIAVDGLAGQQGDIVLGWEFEPTVETLPVILEQPQSQVVARESVVQFNVVAVGATSVQWYFQGAPLPGAITPILIIPSAGDSHLGNYVARLSNGARFTDSRAAILQFNITGVEVQQVFATDKFADVEGAVPVQLGGSAAPVGAGFAPAAVVRGYTGSQVFNTAGSTTSGGEEPICGVMGGASEWISFVAAENGVLFLNTDGSTYNTVMAVFKRLGPGTALQQVACDNDSGLDGRDSSLSVPVEAGRTNYIVVDGVNSVTGTLKLNYSLVTPARLTSVWLAAQNAQLLRFNGRAGARFVLQRSGNLATWATLVTTNAVNGAFEFVDPNSTNAGVRFYRAILLP